MAEHSKLPPSSASRRVACAGSRALEELYPEDEESPHAREGHAAHWLAAKVLHWKLETHGQGIFPSFNMPSHDPDGEPIDKEMIEGAKLYAKHILDTFQGTAGTIHIEERVDISTIHPDCWGTPDAWMITGDRRQLHIWDYKYGHKFVEVFENWQLIEYTAGIMQHMEVNGIEDQYLTVHFHIVQPRSYDRDGPIRVWRILGSDLRPYFNVLRHKEIEAMEPQAVCKPSPECTYCTGRHACAVLQRSSMDAADMALMNVPLELSPAATGQELRMLRYAANLLDARVTGLEEQALAMIKRGDRVPFFKVEQTMGRERWAKDASEVIMLGELMGVCLKKPSEAITPKQAIDAGMPAEVIKAYTERKPGALKLVVENEDNARKIFGGGK